MRHRQACSQGANPASHTAGLARPGPGTERLSANAHCQHNTCALRDTRLASLLWRCDPLWRQCIRSIVVETFNIFLNKKNGAILFYFLCILLFCEFLMYFFVFATYVFYCFFIWNIDKYNSDFNCNESKYCILELKMEFWHKKPFSIGFVHKSRKFSNFEPTVDYIMLRNFGTVRPIFPKIAPKVAQDFKEKSHESSRRGKYFPRNYRAKRRGGADSAPPPPGPFRVKSWLQAQNIGSLELHKPWNQSLGGLRSGLKPQNTWTLELPKTYGNPLFWILFWIWGCKARLEL